MEKTIKELAEEVIQIQDACNIVALSKLFNEHCIELLRITGSMSEVNAHPIMMMWMNKFVDMTGFDEGLDYYFKEVYIMAHIDEDEDD